MRRLNLIALAAFILIYTPLLTAKEYQVEVLIFENLTPDPSLESYQYDLITPPESEAINWPLEPSLLVEQATAINNSANYRLLHHYTWGQETLPKETAAVVTLAEQNLTGWIKVYAKHLLFANLEIEWNGFRLQENRRMKLNEKHYFDHPKFGVLLQVSRLEPETEEADSDESEIESENQQLDS